MRFFMSGDVDEVVDMDEVSKDEAEQDSEIEDVDKEPDAEAGDDEVVEDVEDDEN